MRILVGVLGLVNAYAVFIGWISMARGYLAIPCYIGALVGVVFCIVAIPAVGDVICPSSKSETDMEAEP